MVASIRQIRKRLAEADRFAEIACRKPWAGLSLQDIQVESGFVRRLLVGIRTGAARIGFPGLIPGLPRYPHPLHTPPIHFQYLEFPAAEDDGVAFAGGAEEEGEDEAA